MVIFKSKQKKFEGYLKIKSCSKRLYTSVKIDTDLCNIMLMIYPLN